MTGDLGAGIAHGILADCSTGGKVGRDTVLVTNTLE